MCMNLKKKGTLEEGGEKTTDQMAGALVESNGKHARESANNEILYMRKNNILRLAITLK